ncbi:ABC transporter ATP-binding protein [Oricola thermophila]|uniref:ABC transporter ATP-binding protein n=1 Tax=Oricola thermophila TaxID=2742145 RepID=A0A6N1VG79_9HYPH|nr:ATP-binding cassette domain-containing protein [Oricola thermophila]QKV18262.1 ABC transporter ATP-binding protein [Oricola thermophila]
MSAPLLSLRDVSKVFWLGEREVVAVDGVSFDVSEGECLAIVGESGSGKSTIANMLLGILPPSSGTIALRGEPLPEHRTLAHRRAIQLVQQNPLSSLNPKRSIGASLRLPLDVHGIGTRSERRKRVEALLEEVHLPAEYSSRSPAALSGGQRQRVAIARALASESELVVLDEPTSALDVLVQARILRLLKALQKRRGLTYVFITHDLSVVRNIADRVAVIEKGRLVELGPVEAIFTNPTAPYTRRLIAAVPVITDEEQALKDGLIKKEEWNVEPD